MILGGGWWAKDPRLDRFGFPSVSHRRWGVAIQ